MGIGMSARVVGFLRRRFPSILMMVVLLLKRILLFRLMMGGRFLRVARGCYLMGANPILRDFIDLQDIDL